MPFACAYAGHELHDFTKHNVGTFVLEPFAALLTCSFMYATWQLLWTLPERSAGQNLELVTRAHFDASHRSTTTILHFHDTVTIYRTPPPPPDVWGGRGGGGANELKRTD